MAKELKRGLMVDEWKLVEKLGEGACGQVWSATRDGDSTWVVKLAPLQDPTKAGKGRKKKKGSGMDKRTILLKREYDMYRAVLEHGEHPCLPRIPFEAFGWDEGSGYAYMGLERLGLDVRSARRSDKSVPVEFAARFMVDALEGLEHVHKAGVVVVDMKPDNFMLEQGGGGRIRLVDFGGARFALTIEGELAGSGHVEGTRIADGTPKYIARECHHGGKATYATDLEGLGYVLADLLSGDQLPWSEAESMDEVSDLKDASTPESITRHCKPKAGQKLALDFLKAVAALPRGPLPNYKPLITPFKTFLKSHPPSSSSSSSSSSSTPSSSSRGRARGGGRRRKVVEEEEENSGDGHDDVLPKFSPPEKKVKAVRRGAIIGKKRGRKDEGDDDVIVVDDDGGDDETGDEAHAVVEKKPKRRAKAKSGTKRSAARRGRDPLSDKLFPKPRGSK